MELSNLINIGIFILGILLAVIGYFYKQSVDNLKDLYNKLIDDNTQAHKELRTDYNNLKDKVIETSTIVKRCKNCAGGE